MVRAVGPPPYRLAQAGVGGGCGVADSYDRRYATKPSKDIDEQKSERPLRNVLLIWLYTSREVIVVWCCELALRALERNLKRQRRATDLTRVHERAIYKTIRDWRLSRSRFPSTSSNVSSAKGEPDFSRIRYGPED